METEKLLDDHLQNSYQHKYEQSKTFNDEVTSFEYKNPSSIHQKC